MDIENMKNMVVLKNLPSNIVDEAIVILKPNIKLKSLDFVENKNNKNKVKNGKNQNPKRYIINEAEMVVSSYLSKIENQKKDKYKVDKKIQNKYKRLKAISIFLSIMLLASYLIK